MPVKVTLREALNAHAAIQTLPGKMPVKASYWLGRIGKHLARESDQYNEERVKLLKLHGTLQEDGLNFKLEGAKRLQFEEALSELLDVEIEVPFDQVALSEIIGKDEKNGGPEITAAAFEALQAFIKE